MRVHDFIDGSAIKRAIEAHMVLLVPTIKISSTIVPVCRKAWPIEWHDYRTLSSLWLSDSHCEEGPRTTSLTYVIEGYCVTSGIAIILNFCLPRNIGCPANAVGGEVELIIAFCYQLTKCAPVSRTRSHILTFVICSEREIYRKERVATVFLRL